MGGLQPPQDKARSLVGFPNRCPADPATMKASKKASVVLAVSDLDKAGRVR